MVVRYVKVFRSLQKFVLHPLIHTLLEFTLAQSVVGVCEGGRAIDSPA